MEQGVRALTAKSTRPRKLNTPKYTPYQKHLVLKVRRKFPVWGKIKIQAYISKKHNENITVSTVGRIISKLIAQNQVKPVSYYAYNYVFKKSRKRRFVKHAKRWKIGYKAKKPGELVQIDHMTIIRDGQYAPLHA